MRAVLYTDGGAEPPRGPGGSGVFGYEFETETTPPTDDGWYPTDQGFYTHKTIPKDAKWVSVIRYFELVVSYPMAVTNNIAELGAAIRGFELILEKRWTSVWLRPDSEYVLQNFNDNLSRWRKSGWLTAQGDPIKNQAQWERLYQLSQDVERLPARVQWRWVKGHSDDPGNQRADQLATRGKGFAALAQAINECHTYEAEQSKVDQTEYPDVSLHLSMPRWYFTNDQTDLTPTTSENRTVYYGGAHGKDDELFAKRMADSCYVVSWLHQADPVLELLRAKQIQLNQGGYCQMVIGHLDTITSKKTYEGLLATQGQWVDTIPGTNDLTYGGDQLLTHELVRPRLAHRAVDVLLEGETLLQQYLTNTLPDSVLSVEITSDLYDLTEKKGKVSYKLKKEHTTASKTITVHLPYRAGDSVAFLETRAMLGQDLPRRNVLSAMAKHSPKVTVLCWSKDPQSVYFGTIVDTTEGTSIWLGWPANYRILPQE